MNSSKSIKIAPSILSADFARLKDEIEVVARAGADYLHIDVMDGHFVPNITIGPCVVAALKKVSTIPLDVHLMIDSPEKYLRAFVEAGSDWVTFHVEASPDPHQFIQQARAMGIKIGIAIKPATSVETIVEFLGDIDLVLIMSVEPGFGGQKFNPSVLAKIEQIKKHRPRTTISIDGGVNLQTASLAARAGVDILVAGSSIFHAPEPGSMVQRLREVAHQAL